jgi:hypothetical protein
MRCGISDRQCSVVRVRRRSAEAFCREASKRSFTRAIEASGTSSGCPDCLCGASLISMVKSTDLWDLDDPVRLVRLNCPTFWCVLIQGQVGAGFVIQGHNQTPIVSNPKKSDIRGIPGMAGESGSMRIWSRRNRAVHSNGVARWAPHNFRGHISYGMRNANPRLAGELARKNAPR